MFPAPFAGSAYLMRRWNKLLMIAGLILSVAIVLLATEAYSPSHQIDNVVTFCGVGSNPDRAGRVYFDLKKKVAFASDTSSFIDFIETPDYKGFSHPFPLMVPSRRLLMSTEPIVWTSNGYKFLANQASGSNNSWILIHASEIEAEPKTNGSYNHGTDVLYSSNSGVIAYKRFFDYDDKHFEDEYYNCGERKFLSSDTAK